MQMKHKTLVLMCGPAGSGKSSWVAKEQEHNRGKVKSCHVSRDLCRFELVKENEEYFSKEDEVFKMFINKINEKLADKSTEVIYVDATQSTDLTVEARKVLGIPEGRTLETLQQELQAQALAEAE
jgi:predicted kinase